MQIDIVVTFFMLGFIARTLKAPIDFPQGLYKGIILFLLLAIGLKGGIALSEYSASGLLSQSIAVLAIGVVLPLIAFPVLLKIGGLDRDNAASIAAHYGSVSIGTYAVAVSFLETSDVFYEPYFPLFVALLEIPAIAVGVWLVRGTSDAKNMGNILHEVFLNQGVLLLVGGLIIGWWAGEARSASVMPLFAGMFQGVLALFLLYMGLVAAEKLSDIKQHGNFIASFAIVMPLLGAVFAGTVGHLIGLSTGGITLLATLGASASYIAVPAAMAVAIPTANQSLSITASLAITFPFNVVVGIPLYAAVITNLGI